MIRISVDGHPS